jgi:hypothetical protein
LTTSRSDSGGIGQPVTSCGSPNRLSDPAGSVNPSEENPTLAGFELSGSATTLSALPLAFATYIFPSGARLTWPPFVPIEPMFASEALIAAPLVLESTS